MIESRKFGNSKSALLDVLVQRSDERTFQLLDALADPIIRQSMVSQAMVSQAITPMNVSSNDGPLCFQIWPAQLSFAWIFRLRDPSQTCSGEVIALRYAMALKYSNWH